MERIGDYNEFLRQARDAVGNLYNLRQARDQIAAKLRQDRRLLDGEKKAAEEDIRRTTKKRLEGITSGYDKQIARIQDQLRKARGRREDAKGKGVRERIAEETKDLREENRKIRFQIKTMFQERYVPRLCNTKAYYALFLPKWPEDYLILLLTALLCFFLIPVGAYLLIPNRKIFMLVLIYVADVLLFAGAYVLIGSNTKDDYIEPLKEGRKMRGQIRANKKNIRAVTKAIKRDLNEDAYNLGQYDDEIAKIQQELTELAAKKKEAVNTFETVTKNIIIDEITENHKARIEELSAAVAKGDREFKDLETSVKNKELHLMERYAPYLGQEFLTPERLDALIEIMGNGSASNLTEAVQMYNQSHAKS